MFLALRELRAARGRFALIGTVVALITLLLVMLSGLTEGLSKQNTSALEALGHEYEQASFSTQKPTFTESEIYADDVVPGSAPLGTSQTKVEGFGGVAVLGLPAGEPIPGTKQQVPATGVVASQAITQGNSVVIGNETYAVRATVPDLYYSHSPVLWVSTQTWAQLSHAPSDVVGTALLHANSV
ncbi:TPA: ABC transporter permease, partial [Corynebacterium striatum]|nr:ABC transporter permease [Corynebacterium striatum]